MSNRTYLCTKCGTIRRASAVCLIRRKTWDEMQASAAWPKHCGRPMKSLTFAQGVAVTHIENAQRIKWAGCGLHIIQRGGKRKWIPALNARQVADAKQQLAEFLGRQPEKI